MAEPLDIPWDARTILYAGAYTPVPAETDLRSALIAFRVLPSEAKCHVTLACQESIRGKQYLLADEVQELIDIQDGDQ